MGKTKDAETGRRQTLLVTALRNEGPFLLEWVAYHQVIGFDTIQVFVDDSLDGSAELAAALADCGAIELATCEGPGGHRKRAYAASLETAAFRQADWAMALDTNEFLNIHLGTGQLDDLLDAAGEADVLSPNWRLFGHGGEVAFKDAPVLSRFTRAAPTDMSLSERQFGLKSLFRPEIVDVIGPHRPTLVKEHAEGSLPTKWLNGSGQDITEIVLQKGWALSAANAGQAWAQINHYFARGAETFALHNLRHPPLGSAAAPLSRTDFEALNLNHDTDETILTLEKAVNDAMERLRSIPAVANSHEKSIKLFRKEINRMKKDGGKNSADIEAICDRKAAKQVVAAQTNDLARQRSGDVANAQTMEATEQAPRWLADLRRSEHRVGWYRSDVNFAAQYTRRDRKVLIVSFDNLSSVRDPSLARETWGYGFYASKGWSHLGVMAFERNWYRDDALFDFMEAQRGLFASFDRVILTGTSMGGYAATAFADLAPGCSVLAFSPQSTLHKKLVPWEERFSSGRKQDWSGRYADAVTCCGKAKEVIVIYDPYFLPDKAHAERYEGENVLHLKSWYSSHKSAQFMRRAEILKAIVESVVSGGFSPTTYYRMFRSRRDLIWYYNGLADHLLEKGHKGLAAKLADHLQTIDRPGIARSIKARL